MVKKIILFLIFSIISLFSVGQDILGSHITYKALDSSSYIITLTVFQDCHNKTMPNDSIEIRWDTGAYYFKRRVYKVSERDVTGYSINCSIQSQCSDTGKYGVKELIYIDTISVAAIPKCTFDIIWIGKRKAATGFAAENLYCYSTLNKCLINPNNSVSYKTPLQFLKYSNSYISISVGKIDEKDTTDSLSISLQCPLKDESSIIKNYKSRNCDNSPCSFSFPTLCGPCPLDGYLGFPSAKLSFPAGCQFNKHTGTFVLRTTTTNEFKYYCFEVREWREVNGIQQVIATTRYDMSTLVIDYTNNLPYIKWSPNIDVCAGELLEYTIEPLDRDDDSISIQWQSNLPNASIKIIDSNTRAPKLNITWQSDTSHLAVGQYYITVKVNDNKCPFNGITEKTYSINVTKTPDTLDFYTTKSVKCNSVELNGYRKTGLKNLYFKWLPYDSSSQVFGNSVSLTFQKKGWQKYILQPNTSTCVGKNYIDSIFIPSHTVSNDTTVCFKSTLSLSASMQNVYLPLTYSWLGTNVTGSTINVLPESDSTFIIKITDANNCEVYDSIEVKTHPKIEVTLGTDTSVCSERHFTFKATSQNAVKPIDYFWNSIKRKDSFSERISTSKLISLEIIDSNNCTAKTTKYITVNKLPHFTLGPDKKICKSDSLILSPDIINVQTPFNYKWSNGSTSEKLSLKINQTKKYILEIEDINGCVNYDSILLTALDKPIIDFTNSRDTGFVFSEIDFFNQSKLADIWLWNIIDISGNIIYTNNQRQFSYNFPQEGSYSIKLEGKNKNCSAVKTKNQWIKIFAKPTLSVEKNNKIRLRCYPNPTDDFFIIEGGYITDISIFNSLGKHADISYESLSANSYKVYTQNLTSGAYLVKTTFAIANATYEKFEKLLIK